MRMIFGADEYLAAWVGALMPTPHTSFAPCTAIGSEVDGKLAGAVVYHDYQPGCRSIQMSLAAVNKRWLSKTAIKTYFWYPFEQLKCERVTVIVASKNKPSRSLAEGVGFLQEGVVRKGFGSDDAIIYGMLKDECRWIKGLRHGQEFTRSTRRA